MRWQSDVMTRQVGPGLAKPECLAELEARYGNEARVSGFHRGPQPASLFGAFRPELTLFTRPSGHARAAMRVNRDRHDRIATYGLRLHGRPARLFRLYGASQKIESYSALEIAGGTTADLCFV